MFRFAHSMKEKGNRTAQIRNLLGNARHIAITMHDSPDGDAVGSALGLWAYLEKKGYDAQVISPNEYPAYYHWISGHKEVLFHNKEPELCEARMAAADLVFCLDFNTPGRLCGLEDALLASGAPKIMIDHHPHPADLFDVSLADPTSSSTAGLVYEFILGLGDSDLIGRDVAEALYTGLLTDTGCFRYSSTDARTLQTAAALIDCGVDHEAVCSAVYDNNSEHRLRLTGYCLSEKMQVLDEYKTVLIALSAEELNRFHYKTGDTEDLVNYGLTIAGMRMSALITERSDEIKVSLRSKGDFAVNRIAREHFNGGGHKHAAGGQTLLTLDETVEKLLSLLPRYKEELNA
ncbi:MAG: bifunctional oligoribonuclease/PAP phosphatase NrnA [Flavobacteriales bacterium]